jgi:hypothetical protein
LPATSPDYLDSNSGIQVADNGDGPYDFTQVRAKLVVLAQTGSQHAIAAGICAIVSYGAAALLPETAGISSIALVAVTAAGACTKIGGVW